MTPTQRAWAATACYVGVVGVLSYRLRTQELTLAGTVLALVVIGCSLAGAVLAWRHRGRGL